MALQQLARCSAVQCMTSMRCIPAVLQNHVLNQRKNPHLLNMPSFCGRSLHIVDVQSTFNDYEHERRTYNLIVPNKFNFARDVIDVWAAAEQTGQRDDCNPALWWIDDKGAEKKFSFQTMSKLSCRVSNVLTGPCQLSHGDRLIAILPRIPEWWMINLGCIRAGIAISPGSIMLRAKDIKHRLLSSRAKCIIADDSTVDFVEEVYKDCPDLKTKVYVGDSLDTRPGWLNFNDLMSKASESFEAADTAASDPMTLFFTSGTTGNPKMTEHSQASYGLGHLNTARYAHMVGPKDVLWNITDTGWAKSAWSSLFGPWLHGSCVFTEHSSKFDAMYTLKVLCKYPVSHLCFPPTVARHLVKEPLSDYKLKSLRHVVSGGETVNPEMKEAWQAGTGLDIHELYGQSETTLLVSRPPCIPYRVGSMGKAAPGVDVQIVDEEGVPVERGKEGIIAVRVLPTRPVGLFTGYVDEPEKTNAMFKGDFYLTGDRGHMDEDDYIFFLGRDDDIISSAGYRIGPSEVENALLENPAVVECAVVSSPDETRGEIVKAFVMLTSTYQSSDPEKLVVELQEHVKKVTAPYKYPRKIEFVTEFPKTVSGKIRRVELREKEWKNAR